MIEDTFEEAWLKEIYRNGNYLAINGIARSYGLDPMDLRQEVALWFHDNCDQLEQHVIAADNSEHYLIKCINNGAKVIGRRLQEERFSRDDTFFYDKALIRTYKYDLAKASSNYTLASDTHAVYIDFGKAFNTLTLEDQDIFLTPPAEYPEDKAENKKFRTRVSKLTQRVWRLMNDSAYMGSKELVDA